MLIHRVEQKSLEWHMLRLAKVTGSTAKTAAINGKGAHTLMHKLIAEQLTGESQDSDFISGAMQQGIDREGPAIGLYSLMHDVECDTSIGFIERSEHDGFSPDATVWTGGQGGLAGEQVISAFAEVKSPEPKTHVGYICDNKVPAEHMPQIKMGFRCIPSAVYCDFISYNEEIHDKQLFVKRVMRVDIADELGDFNQKIDAFIKNKNARLKMIKG